MLCRPPQLPTVFYNPLAAAEHKLVLPGVGVSHTLIARLAFFEVSPERAEHTAGSLTAGALERHIRIYGEIKRVFICVCVDNIAVDRAYLDVVPLYVVEYILLKPRRQGGALGLPALD